MPTFCVNWTSRELDAKNNPKVQPMCGSSNTASPVLANCPDCLHDLKHGYEHRSMKVINGVVELATVSYNYDEGAEDHVALQNLIDVVQKNVDSA